MRVAVGILTSKNRYEKLQMCLMSIVMQTVLPNKVILIDNNIKPNMKVVKRVLGLLQRLTEVRIFYAPNLTMSELRQKILNESKGEDLLYFVDDDVVLYNDALAQGLKIIKKRKCGFIQGSKVDIDNIRNYKDYKIFKKRMHKVFRKPHFFYPEKQEEVAVILADTGNLLVDRKKLIDIGGFKFSFMKKQTGEDTIVGCLLADKYGGFFVPQMRAWHFSEKFDWLPLEKVRCFVVQYLTGKVKKENLVWLKKVFSE